jgi:hypothetical protein
MPWPTSRPPLLPALPGLLPCALLGVLLCGAGACTGATELLVVVREGTWPGPEALPVERARLEVGPAPSLAAEPTAVTGAPTGLAVLAGRVVVGAGAQGLLAPQEDGALALAPVPLDAAALGVAVGGPARALAPRQAGGLLALLGDSVLHDFGGRFWASPLSGRLPAGALRSLDVSGQQEAEVVWLALEDRTLGLSPERRLSVRLEGRAAPTFAAGLPNGWVLLAVEGDLVLLDPDSSRALRVLAGVGAVHGVARRAGSVFLATDAGLVERTPSGRLRLTTLVDAEGGAALPVVAVTASGGALHLLAGGRVLALGPDGLLPLAALPPAASPGAPGPRLLAVDGRGHAWVGGPGGLVRLRTGDAVSFSRVQPFLTRHCATCHDGADTHGAPTLPLHVYEGAVAWAPRILARLADPNSPMPPRRVELLLPEEWSLVQRWVDGGMKP